MAKAWAGFDVLGLDVIEFDPYAVLRHFCVDSGVFDVIRVNPDECFARDAVFFEEGGDIADGGFAGGV